MVALEDPGQGRSNTSPPSTCGLLSSRPVCGPPKAAAHLAVLEGQALAGLCSAALPSSSQREVERARLLPALGGSGGSLRLAARRGGPLGGPGFSLLFLGAGEVRRGRTLGLRARDWRFSFPSDLLLSPPSGACLLSVSVPHHCGHGSPVSLLPWPVSHDQMLRLCGQPGRWGWDRAGCTLGLVLCSPGPRGLQQASPRQLGRALCHLGAILSAAGQSGHSPYLWVASWAPPATQPLRPPPEGQDFFQDCLY